MARWRTLCDKVFQWLTAGQWFSQGTPISSNNKTDCHDVTEILLKMVLNTIKKQPSQNTTMLQNVAIWLKSAGMINAPLTFNRNWLKFRCGWTFVYEYRYWFEKNQRIGDFYVYDAIIKLKKRVKGTVKILPVAYSMADDGFIWTWPLIGCYLMLWWA